MQLTNSMFREHVNRLIQALDRVCCEQKDIPPPAPAAVHVAEPPKSGSKRMRSTVIAVAFIAALVLLYFVRHRSTHGASVVNPPGKSASGDGSATSSQHPPSALITAIQEGRLDDARNLITNGANVNAANPDGTTALMQAAEGSPYMPNNAPAMAMLLDKGASVDAQDNRGRTALYRAATEGKTEVMRLLLTRKANPNEKANDGSTPLLAAITFGRADAMHLPLTSGSEVNLPDAHNSTRDGR